MIEKTDERMEELAEVVLDKMDLGEVMGFVKEKLIITYMENEDVFQEDWDFHMEDNL